MRRSSPSLRLAPHDSWGPNVISSRNQVIYLNFCERTTSEWMSLRKEKPSKQCLHAHQGHCDIDIASALSHLFGLKQLAVSSSRCYAAFPGWWKGHFASAWRIIYRDSRRSVVARFARVEISRSEDHGNKVYFNPNIPNNTSISTWLMWATALHGIYESVLIKFIFMTYLPVSRKKAC